MADCYVLITNSEIDNVLLRALSGEEIGTFSWLKAHPEEPRCWIILAKAWYYPRGRRGKSVFWGKIAFFLQEL